MLIHATLLGTHSAHWLLDFYPRDAMLARVILIATCLSVCPSVTRRYCVKTKKASVVISAPSGSPIFLVFWCQISSHNSKGFPRTAASKKGGVGKFSDFLAFSRCLSLFYCCTLYCSCCSCLRINIFNISKTVADRAKVTISD